MTGDVDLLVLGVSSAGVDWAITRIAAALTVPVPIVVVTKGLAMIEGSIDLLPNVITRGVGALTGLALPVMAVGGPCIAGELAVKRNTTVVVAGHDEGGDRPTVAGLAGAGDLYVTCQGGRNGRLGRLLGQGLTYSKAKSEHIKTDTVQGAELALTIGPILDTMAAEGGLAGNRMHLTSAIVGAICGDEPLDMPWRHFHHGT